MDDNQVQRLDDSITDLRKGIEKVSDQLYELKSMMSGHHERMSRLETDVLELRGKAERHAALLDTMLTQGRMLKGISYGFAALCGIGYTAYTYGADFLKFLHSH